MLRQGDILVGRYEIEALLGEGGMGAVFRALDTLKQRKVAIKEFRLGDLPSEQEQAIPDGTRINRKTPAPLTREAALKLFKKEAYLLSPLNHPNLPEVFDFFILGNDGYIVMTLIEGRSLADVLEENGGPLPEEQVRGWLLQVLDALQYCHGQGVVHRDLKPENLLLTHDGRIYLIDFGIAKALNPGQQATSTGSRILSPGYAPLEQYSAGGSGPDARTDLYSLGAVAYALLTGTTPMEATERAIGEALLAPRSLNPVVPVEMETFILCCLQINKSDRPQSAAEASGILTRKGAQSDRLPVLPGKATTPVQPFVVPEPAPSLLPRRKAPWKKVLGIAGGILLLGLLIWTVTTQILPPVTAGIEQTRTARAEINRLSEIAAGWTDTPTITPSPIATLTPTLTAPQAFTSTFTLTSTSTSIPPDCTQKGQTWTSPIDGMVLVCVPAGEFSMGSTTGGEDEQPVHTVFLDAFWIDQTEVTNARYAQCVADGACELPSSTASYTRPDYFGNSEFNQYPVIYVNWQEAMDYCTWADRALPTEAQWEKAARGDDGRTYPWGNEPPTISLANYDGIFGDTTRAGSYPDGKSPYGAVDMAGNVWEWVADWYGTYPSDFQNNPIGPASGDYRVWRGGSWDHDQYFARVLSRRGRNPHLRLNFIGFRCVLSPGF